MMGTFATSGSLPNTCRKRVIAVTPSIMPSSMQTSSTLAPFSTCCRAMLTASSYLPALISLANFGEPATLVRSPIMMYTPCLLRERLRPGKTEGPSLRCVRDGAFGRAHVRLPIALWRANDSSKGVSNLRGGWPLSAFAIAAMCSGVFPQQPPAMLINPPRANSPRVAGHVLRPKIETRFRKRIRQARIGIARDRHVRLFRKFLQKWIHEIGTERAVEANRQRFHVPHRVPECLGRLRGDHRLASAPHRR